MYFIPQVGNLRISPPFLSLRTTKSREKHQFIFFGISPCFTVLFIHFFFISLLLRQPSIQLRHFMNFSYQRFIQLPFFHPPNPISAKSRWRVDPRFRSQAEIILQWNDAKICYASHCHCNEIPCQLILIQSRLAKIFFCKITAFLRNGMIPVSCRRIIMCSRINDAVLRLSMRQIVRSLPGIKRKLYHFHPRKTGV